MTEFQANATYNEVVFSTEWRKHRGPEYEEYRRQWVDVPASKQALDHPIHLDIETTTACNLRCPMCPRTLMVQQGTFGDEYGMMSGADYRRVIKQAAEIGVKSIKLNYLGEPLLHKEVVDQVLFAKELGIVDVMMNTNGSALTPRNSELLLRAGLDGLFVSLDAVNPKLFEQQRVGTSLGRVLDNLWEFRKLRDAIHPGCQIRASMVMYQDPIWQRQFEAMAAVLDGVVDAIGWGHYVSHTDGDTPDGISRPKEYPEVPGFHCAQPFQRMFLKYCGNATICCVDSADEEVVGNWRESDLWDIWNGDRYREIRGLHAGGKYYCMGICRKCYLPVSEPAVVLDSTRLDLGGLG